MVVAFHQNLFLACVLSAIGSCISVLAIVALAYPEFRKSKHNVKYQPTTEKMFFLLNIICQIVSGLTSTVASWFGPVSIVVPINVAAQLLSNMFFFGILGIEKFPKGTRIGTYFVATASLLLPYVGPTVQDQNVIELITQPSALIWTSLLLAATVLSGYFCLVWVNEKQKTGVVKNKYKAPILLIARVCASVLSTTASKALPGVSGIAFFLSFILFLALAILIFFVAILQATEVDQGSFVPFSSCGNIVLNAITGLIIWQDYLVIQSSVCYSIVMIQILMGVYLISSIDVLSSSADQSYALSQSVKILVAKDIADQRGKYLASFAGGSIPIMLANSNIEEEDEEEDDEDNRSHSRSVMFDNKMLFYSQKNARLNGSVSNQPLSVINGSEYGSIVS